MYISAYTEIPNALYLSISFSVYVAPTQSLFGACCLRMLLRLHHYLDRGHSDLYNMLFVQYVDRESRYNMWSRVKAFLSHMVWWLAPLPHSARVLGSRFKPHLGPFCVE